MSNNEGVSAPPPAPPAPAKAKPKIPQWVSAIVGVVFLLIGLNKLYHVFFPSLPGCSADTATGLVRKIFKDKDVELTSLTNVKTITDTSAQKTCQADVTTAKETAVVSYQISWQGKDVRVLITHVDAHPR